MSCLPADQVADQVRSMRHLGLLLGRSTQSISRYCRRHDWPFPRRPPWPASAVPAMCQWQGGLTPDPGAGAGAKNPLLNQLQQARSAAQLAVAVERVALLKLERLIVEGQYAKRAGIEESEAAKIAMVRSVIMKISDALAPRLAEMKDFRLVHDCLNNALRAVCNHFARG